VPLFLETGLLAARSQQAGNDRGSAARVRLPLFLPPTDLFTGSVSLKLVDWRQPCPSF